MAFSFLSYWNYGSRYCGIEYGSASNGTPRISVLRAIKKKTEFEVVKTFETKDFRECAKKLPKNQHAFLCLNHNQVLLKQTVTTGPAVKVVSSAFPNVDLNDFYFEVLSGSSGSIVALCRKEHVHQIINSFEEQKITIIGFSLGFSSYQNVLPIIEEKEIYLSSCTLITNDKEIISFEKSSERQEEVTYKIGDPEIESKFLLPLSALFNYWAGNIYTENNFSTKNKDLEKNYNQKVFFRKGLATAITLLLGMLLINFFLFSRYYSELEEMTGRYEVDIFQKQIYDEKLLEVLKKEKIADNLLMNGHSKSSFYLNRLIESEPSSVLLREYTFQPLQKKVKENEQIQLEKNLIRIAGESTDESEFSHWIMELELNPIVREAKVSNFKYSSPGTSEFLLTLKLTEDDTVK